MISRLYKNILDVWNKIVEFFPGVELLFQIKAHNCYRLRGEFSACVSKRLIWQIMGVVPEKFIVFNTVGLLIANLRLPRALIYERIEFKPAWPTFQRSFQALGNDTDRRNMPRSVWRPSHRTFFSIFTILFSLSFEYFVMPTRNTPKIKGVILCFHSLQTLLSLLVLVLNTDWLKRL